jgi:hypothetical protein
MSSAKSSTDKRKLGRVGLHNKVSERGVSSVLRAAAADPSLLERTSRQSRKRSIQESAHAENTFGKLITHKTFDSTNSETEKEQQFPVVSPSVWLTHCAETCEGFSDLLQDTYRAHPCSREKPWSLVYYSDEINPADTTAKMNKRKSQAVYWTVKEFGARALSMEMMWFLLSCGRSHIVDSIGGMSVFLSTLLMTFFEVHDMSAGLPVYIGGGVTLLLFFQLAVCVADADALKKTFENKGYSGRLICMLCKNCVSHKSGLSGAQLAGFNTVSILETDFKEFILHTDASVVESIDELARAKPRLKKGQFTEKERNLGFNLSPHGLLMNARLRLKSVSTLMYDWMHVYLVDGIVTAEIGAFMDVLSRDKIAELHNFVSSFIWPSGLMRTSGVKTYFEKLRSKGDQAFKGSASQALSLLPVVKTFVCMKVLPMAEDALKLACQSFLLLCTVISLLMQTALGTVDPVTLLEAIRLHLDSHQVAYGYDHYVPKFHYALHLPLMLQQARVLIACFVNERKHKEIKRFIPEASNGFELSVMEKVVVAQLDYLGNPKNYPCKGATLVEPVQPASERLQGAVHRALGTSGLVESAVSAKNVLCTSSSDDVVHVRHSDDTKVAQVLYHVTVQGECLSCIILWARIDEFVYRRGADPSFIYTDDITGVCIHAPVTESLSLVVSARTWG